MTNKEKRKCEHSRNIFCSFECDSYIPKVEKEEEECYRFCEKLLNDFKNKKIGYSEFIEKQQDFISLQIEKAYTRGRSDEAKTCEGCNENKDKTISDTLDKVVGEIKDKITTLEFTLEACERPEINDKNQAEKIKSQIYILQKLINTLKANNGSAE